MKILLVNPCQVYLVNRRGKIYNRVWPPLELANCAALLERQGHRVQITDANALRLSPQKIGKIAIDFDKVFICSSSLDRWQCPNPDLEPFLNTVASVRKFTDEFFIIGPHGTVRPKELLEVTQAKAVVRGEPELKVAEICKGKQLADIKGIAFRENGSMVLTEEAEPVDLNDLPMPAFHLLPMEKYFYEVLGSRLAVLEGSRGCASSCTFCLLKMYGKGVRRKSIPKLVAEVEYAISRFGVKTCYFMDLEFTVFREGVLELCDYLIKKQYDFRWTCQTRFDLIDEDLLRKMRKAGCCLIHFGVEGGTDELLRKVNKKMTIRQIEENMHMVHRVGIASACFFILGFPGLNRFEIQQTIRFAKQLNPTYALFHIAIPYPGTVLYDEIQGGERQVYSKELFPEACLKEEELERLKRLIRNAYAGYYLRPQYIASRLSKGDFQSLFRQVKLFLGFLRSR